VLCSTGDEYAIRVCCRDEAIGACYLVAGAEVGVDLGRGVRAFCVALYVLVKARAGHGSIARAMSLSRVRV